MDSESLAVYDAMKEYAKKHLQQILHDMLVKHKENGVEQIKSLMKEHGIKEMKLQ